MKNHRSRSWKEELALVERHLEMNEKKIDRIQQMIEALMVNGFDPESPLVTLHTKNLTHCEGRRERLAERRRLAKVEIMHRRERYPSVEYKGKRYVRRGGLVYCQYKIKVPGRRTRVAERLCKPGPTREIVTALIEEKVNG